MITNEEMITDEERQCILGACLISAGTAIENDLQTRNPDNLYVGPYDSINVENLATKFFMTITTVVWFFWVRKNK